MFETPSPGNNNTLILGAREGNMDAFEALMDNWRNRVIRLCWHLLGFEEDALDASQEVFIRLYRNIGRVDPERPLWPWLYRVTVNVCHTHATRKHRFSRIKHWIKLSMPDPVNDPTDGAVFRMDERRIMRQALQVLTQSERTAIVLRDIEGLSTKEVAEMMGSSETTVRSHISRGRIKLREYRQRYLRRSS